LDWLFYQDCRTFFTDLCFTIITELQLCGLVAAGPACWLWDYVKRSGASGFLLPLSGGADSASVAAIVGSMCQEVVQTIKVLLLPPGHGSHDSTFLTLL